ncbi:hypothetical protein [Methylocystis bryophila]|uniref:hypothetical protein n=1 Tax=Methylocystis bryophila TaxID=655015 RepID=UPI001FD9B322|nr:hypothetical protein [Methylocystis bryophila]
MVELERSNLIGWRKAERQGAQNPGIQFLAEKGFGEFGDFPAIGLKLQNDVRESGSRAQDRVLEFLQAGDTVGAARGPRDRGGFAIHIREFFADSDPRDRRAFRAGNFQIADATIPAFQEETFRTLSIPQETSVEPFAFGFPLTGAEENFQAIPLGDEGGPARVLSSIRCFLNFKSGKRRGDRLLCERRLIADISEAACAEGQRRSRARP